MSKPGDPVIELVNADIPRSDTSNGGTAARAVDWQVERGSFWAVGAFAGAGKTDLLLTAAGLQPPVKGELFILGQNLRHMKEEELVSIRLKVAMVFASGRLFSHMTVAENVALPLEYHGGTDGQDAREVVRDALDRVGIGDFAGRLPRQIPRFLHQRVALARALALSPEVLLVDNPLVGGDQRNARWWLDFLSAAHLGDPKVGRRFTIAVTTDDLRPWIDIAEQFGILRERRFEKIGGREQVKNTSEAIVQELLTGAFGD